MIQNIHLIPRGREEDFYSISKLIKETIEKADYKVLLHSLKEDPVATELAATVKEVVGQNLSNDSVDSLDSTSIEELVKTAEKKGCTEIIILCGSMNVPNFIFKINRFFKSELLNIPIIPIRPKQMATFNGKEWIKRE